MAILDTISAQRQAGASLIAQLVDPDDAKSFDLLADRVYQAERAGVDMLFIGGSLITQSHGFDPVSAIKEMSRLPIVTFPSTPLQLHEEADAVLFLSLISGRNPEYLIGHHVAAAPIMRHMDLEVIPTGYMLVDCGAPTTAQYISHSMPMPYDKPEIAASTALAGQMLGLKVIYLDGGSGSQRSIHPDMVAAVKEWVEIPIVVGGGIRTAQQAEELLAAGADVLVVGNAAWKDPEIMHAICTLKQAQSRARRQP